MEGVSLVRDPLRLPSPHPVIVRIPSSARISAQTTCRAGRPGPGDSVRDRGRPASRRADCGDPGAGDGHPTPWPRSWSPSSRSSPTPAGRPTGPPGLGPIRRRRRRRGGRGARASPRRRRARRPRRDRGGGPGTGRRRASPGGGVLVLGRARPALVATADGRRPAAARWPRRPDPAPVARGRPDRGDGRGPDLGAGGRARRLASSRSCSTPTTRAS